MTNKLKVVIVVRFFVLILFLSFSFFDLDFVFSQESEEEIEEEIEEERISLDLKGIDITEVFRLLSLKTGLTIVPSKSVKGRVNIFLNNLTFKDALDVILISQGLAAEPRGDILLIMTSNEYKTRYGKNYVEMRQVRSFKLKYAKPSAVLSVLGNLKSDIGKIIIDEATGMVILIDIPAKLLLMEEVVQDLDQPLATEIIELQYASSSDIREHLETVITEGTGSLVVDERTNKIIITDLPARMDKIRNMVKELDEETRQVFIEAEIVSVALKKEYQRGINWQRIFESGMFKGVDFTGTFDVAPSFSPSPALSTSNIEMSIGTMDADNYTATLQLLETFGDTEILSRPKIAIINNEEARILVGTREAYVTQTQSQAGESTVTSENIEFIDVGVKLTVVPTINKDGFITMKIKPEVSSVFDTLTSHLGSTIPLIETSEIETVVKVKDGTMIMIGGLMKEETREDDSGIPGFSKIPFIGTFFSSHSELTRKTELIIFIKPTIITGEITPPGTEPENLITPKVMPQDMRWSIIAQEVEKITVAPPEGSESGIGKIENELLFKKKESEESELEGKLKGIKEF